MKKIYLFLIVTLFACTLHAQDEVADLQKKLAKATKSNEKCDILNELALIIINEDPEKAGEYANQARELGKKNLYKDGEAFALYNLGNVAYYQDDYETGLKHLDDAELIFKTTQNKKGLGYVYNTKGEILTIEGRYSDALPALFEGLKYFEEGKDSIGISKVDINIGLIHYYQKNYAEAIKYFNQVYTTGDASRKGDASLGLGRVYVDQNNYAEAKKYLLYANEIGVKNNDNYIISDCMLLLGKVDVFYGDKEEAEKKFLRSLEINTELENYQGVCICANQLGLLRLNNGQTKEAIEYFRQAYTVSQDKGIKEETKLACLGLSNAFNFSHSYDSAYHYLKLNNKVNEELMSEEASKKLAELEASLTAQKKEAEMEAERKLAAFNKRVTLYTSIGVVLVMIVISLIMYNRYKMKQKANLKLEAYNNEISHQRDIIEEKHKEITDSINYAERIQRSFLATKELLDNNLKDYFVFFQPKDVVSGDFYWASELSNGNFALVTADSTGHGVPGAIMSILNISSLENSLEHGKLFPGEILNHTRSTIIKRLKKDGSPEGGKDGMDASLICFDFKGNKFHYAAANNPVWVVRGNEIIELPCDKMPVGKHDKDSVPFTQHDFETQKDDVVYALTDGMPDQFGGPKGKKFMYKKLKEMLVEISKDPMETQRQKLKDAINDWKGDLEQVDDICLIGVRIV